MRKTFVVMLAIAAGALIPISAQDNPPAAAAQPASANAGQQIPLKVQLTITKLQGEKKLSSVPYMLGVLSNGPQTSLRMGVQVPVATAVAPKGPTDVAMSTYNYRDVGTNIDCTAKSIGGGSFSLVISLDDSTIHLDRPSETADERRQLREVPAFRSFRASFGTVLREGQTMQYASATDPISGEVIKIDVTLSLAK